MNTVSLDLLNSLDQAAFTYALADIYEHSPWVAQRVHAQRPFTSTEALAGLMARVVDSATHDEQNALTKAHPDLASKWNSVESLTTFSAREPDEGRGHIHLYFRVAPQPFSLWPLTRHGRHGGRPSTVKNKGRLRPLEGRAPSRLWTISPNENCWSHLDTVRDAGSYDGMLGVLLGIACAERLRLAGPGLPFNLDVVSFADEESWKYGTAYLGSAAYMARYMPMSMMFIRCKDGLSHHPDEYASQADIAMALNVLNDCITSIAQPKDKSS